MRQKPGKTSMKTGDKIQNWFTVNINCKLTRKKCVSRGIFQLIRSLYEIKEITIVRTATSRSRVALFDATSEDCAVKKASSKYLNNAFRYWLCAGDGMRRVVWRLRPSRTHGYEPWLHTSSGSRIAPFCNSATPYDQHINKNCFTVSWKIYGLNKKMSPCQQGRPCNRRNWLCAP